MLNGRKNVASPPRLVVIYTSSKSIAIFFNFSYLIYHILLYHSYFREKKSCVTYVSTRQIYRVPSLSPLSLSQTEGTRQKEQISYRYRYVRSQAKKIMYGCYYLNFLGMAKKILAYENLCFFGQPSPQNTANFRMFIIYW